MIPTGAGISGPAPSPAVSVIVPIHNSDATLGPCLEAIARSAARDLEIVVADDRATTRSLEIARAAGFRSVQSTPLISRTGIFLGVVSTHFRTRQWNMEEKLFSQDWRTQCNVAVLQITNALRLW